MKLYISRVINLSSKQVGQALDRFLHNAFHLYINNRQCGGVGGERKRGMWRFDAQASRTGTKDRG